MPQAAAISRGYLIRLEAVAQDQALTVLAKLAKSLKMKRGVRRPVPLPSRHRGPAWAEGNQLMIAAIDAKAEGA